MSGPTDELRTALESAIAAGNEKVRSSPGQRRCGISTGGKFEAPVHRMYCGAWRGDDITGIRKDRTQRGQNHRPALEGDARPQAGTRGDKLAATQGSSRLRKKGLASTGLAVIRSGRVVDGEVADARAGSADGRAVQLCELREPGAGGASAAGDPADRRCRAGGAERGVPAALRRERAALDRAGEAAAGAAAAGVLLGPLGAAADGAAGLQPAVPLVRRARASTTRSGT